MKLIVLTLVFFLWSIARADENVVIEIPAPFWRTQTKAMFEINRLEGRAWVSIESSDGSIARRDRFYSYYRSKVPGLSFDKEHSKIMLDREGAITECAAVESRGRSIFRYDHIINTRCELKVQKVIKEFDNGFEIRKIEMVQVLLKTI